VLPASSAAVLPGTEGVGAGVVSMVLVPAIGGRSVVWTEPVCTGWIGAGWAGGGV
jgi:hypothetical protein